MLTLTARSFAHAVTTRQRHNGVEWVLKLRNGFLYVKEMVYNTFRHGRESPWSHRHELEWYSSRSGCGTALRLGGNWEGSCPKPSDRPELHWFYFWHLASRSPRQLSFAMLSCLVIGTVPSSSRDSRAWFIVRCEGYARVTQNNGLVKSHPKNGESPEIRLERCEEIWLKYP